MVIDFIPRARSLKYNLLTIKIKRCFEQYRTVMRKKNIKLTVLDIMLLKKTRVQSHILFHFTKKSCVMKTNIVHNHIIEQLYMSRKQNKTMKECLARAIHWHTGYTLSAHYCIQRKRLKWTVSKDMVDDDDERVTSGVTFRTNALARPPSETSQIHEKRKKQTQQFHVWRTLFLFFSAWLKGLNQIHTIFSS